MALRNALQRSLSSYSTIRQGLSKRSLHNTTKVSYELESFASCSSTDLDYRDSDNQVQPLARKPEKGSHEVNFVKFEIQQLHVNVSITNNFNTFPKAGPSSKVKPDAHEHTVESPKPKK